MLVNFNLDETVILDEKFRQFLKLKNKEIKYNVILNLLLCNYFDDNINNITNERSFILRHNIKYFLLNHNNFNGDEYSLEGVKLLLNKFVNKRIINITI